ncbi:Hsp70 family protein [Saccharothrix deserti]|uniref:Hsp70 family protein n=1 Tax=Saccharothrix deserti TaxID=2593674 RepID=UPI00131E6990|nr:Hsp70 family protein [Saccharothrix deserti]
MSDTVDFGIDLGTTNSAIARFVDGRTVMIKNNDQWEFTPSAVWINKRGEVRVGRAARDQAMRDVDNAHLEFKLEMGLEGAVRRFAAAGATLTPPQLSAEVLKSLRDDVTQSLGAPPEAAVITVPAAFRLHQNNATSEAAALAGFGACTLLQEPTAAAFAYGFQHQSTEAYWMVFDFGGGTFDAAIVSTYEGELRVLDHAGDPHMGGKLIDWAIVDRVLAPAAAREFGLADFSRGNRLWAANFAKLKWAAEEAKIGLSRQAEVSMTVDLRTADGRDVEFDHVLRREVVDGLAEPFYARAINLCRAALAKANLGAADIDRLLLVGGATLAPGLRARLADPELGLGITLDHSQDPSTVVARGAAVFAGTVPLERPAYVPVAGEYSVELRYPRTTSLSRVAVGGRFGSTSSTVDWTAYRVELDNPTARPPFRSPKITLDETGAFVAEVVLTELDTSTFTVLLTGPRGARERVVPDTFTIRHWANEPGGSVLTNGLGLAQADGTFALMLAKGARLPAVTTETFRTTVPLRRTDADAVIRIPIVEGERDRADRNLEVAVIEIRPRDVRIDLPEGAEVEITFEVDESRRVSVIADVPLVQEQFEATIDLSVVAAPSSAALRKTLAEVEQRAADLRGSAERALSERALARFAQLDQERMLGQAADEVRAADGDRAGAAAADQRLRDIQAVLDDIEADVRLPRLLADMSEAVEACRELVDRVGTPDDLVELADLERRAEQARASEDAEAAERVCGRALDLEVVLMRRDGSLDVTVFHYFRANADRMASPDQARVLINRGEHALMTGDAGTLAEVNQRLRVLLPATMPDPTTGGVRRQRGFTA